MSTTLIDKKEVISIYSYLWENIYDEKPDLFINEDSPLPPFLCHNLIFKENLTKKADEFSTSFFNTGDQKKHIQRISSNKFNLYICPAGVNESIIESLPLRGYAIGNDQEKHISFIKDVVDIYDQIDDGNLLQPLKDFESIIIWLDESESKIPKHRMVSSSFPEYLGYIFLSENSLTQIPPNFEKSGLEKIILAENIFHETLHQQISATILFRDIFRESYDAEEVKKIRVPWRDFDWELDRAFHAIIVYSNLIKFRSLVIKSNLINDEYFLSESIEKAIEAKGFLLDESIKMSEYLTDEAIEILRSHE